jgi:structural maintenance of chromosome 3 (chondroitin sulfate proteoglycan 6)
MKIRKLTITGFKSYGEKTVFDGFSAKTNCIVGLNGSGKSTVFNAIEFLLLDEYSFLAPQQRQSLLHHGPHPTQNAFVEIDFDNTDRVIPLDKDNVVIRRSIGPHKDEYFLDKVHTTYADLLNLLEGLNLKQGIFVVKQGRVKAVADMKDSSRLEMMLDVAGIQVYENQRNSSVKILAQAEKYAYFSD